MGKREDSARGRGGSFHRGEQLSRGQVPLFPKGMGPHVMDENLAFPTQDREEGWFTLLKIKCFFHERRGPTEGENRRHIPTKEKEKRLRLRRVGQGKKVKDCHARKGGAAHLEDKE